MVDIMNYLKNKLFRRKKIEELFGKIEYKPGISYAGISISKWHFDYLSSKSLSPVLNIKPENLVGVERMMYSIKCLIKLNKIMNAKKALLWARNLYAKKLGREESGLKVTAMEEQEKRFYNTFIFDENITFEDFRKTENKAERFFKQYKQLDREINAHYLTRFYNKNVKKARMDHQIGNTKLALNAAVYKQDCGYLIDHSKKTQYTKRKNPVAAYRRIVNMVNQKFEKTHTRLQRLEIIEVMEGNIPQITYGSNSPNDSYIKFCRKAIKEYKAKQFYGTDYEVVCLKEALERTKERIKIEMEMTSSDDDSSLNFGYLNSDGELEMDF
jgi:hypothetical protein